MSSNEPSPFALALAKFRAFFATEGHRTDIHWVFREDIVDRWPSIYVKVPVKTEVALIERLYNGRVNAGLRTNVNVICLLDGRPCCCIWLPQNMEDASSRMLEGVTFSIPTSDSCRKAVPIRSRLRWMWL
jgi:hypothetical protein